MRLKAIPYMIYTYKTIYKSFLMVLIWFSLINDPFWEPPQALRPHAADLRQEKATQGKLSLKLSDLQQETSLPSWPCCNMLQHTYIYYMGYTGFNNRYIIYYYIIYILWDLLFNVMKKVYWYFLLLQHVYILLGFDGFNGIWYDIIWILVVWWKVRPAL